MLVLTQTLQPVHKPSSPVPHPEQHNNYNLPNFLTASSIDFVFSINAYILCSLKSSCCDNASTLGAISRGTTTTPSLSAATMSPAFTFTPSHTTGTPVP